jgi:tryptophan synthase alpha chain
VSRLGDVFARAKRENRAALVTYLCAGDPSLALTPRLIVAAAEAGADVVESTSRSAIPPPTVTIQRASERRRSGATLRGVLGDPQRARETTSRRCSVITTDPRWRVAPRARAKRAGVDGLLVVDLPPSLHRCSSPA